MSAARLPPDAATGEPLYDMLNERGMVLLLGMPMPEACRIIDEHQTCATIRPEWEGDMRIVLARYDAKYRKSMDRHDGPLYLLNHSLGIEDPAFVSARSHVGLVGLDLEEALRRIDQFDGEGQRRLVDGLACHFRVVVHISRQA